MNHDELTDDAMNTEPESQPGSQEYVFDSLEMLDSMISHFRQYLVCDEYQYTLLALWVVHTWLFHYFPTTAYLDIRSAEPQSGKTRCLELLYQLSAHSSYLEGASPETIKACLLKQRSVKEVERVGEYNFYAPPVCRLLDDCHHSFARSERQPLLAMLNCGTRVASCYTLGSTEYSLFGPKAFAGNVPLPRSLASRCIPIVLRRKKPSEVIARFNPGVTSSLVYITTWLQGLHNDPGEITQSAGQTPPNLPVSLTARQQDCAEPLIHIADAIGGPWPARARAAIAAAFELADSSLSLQLLQDVRTCFHINNNPEYLATRDLLAALLACEDRPWKTWTRSSGQRLAGLLQPFGIHSRWLRNEDGKGLRGYSFKDFEDSWERYLPAIPMQQSVDIENSAADATSDLTATALDVAATASITNAVADVPLDSQ